MKERRGRKEKTRGVGWLAMDEGEGEKLNWGWGMGKEDDWRFIARGCRARAEGALD